MGAIINTAAVIIGGLIGYFAGNLLTERCIEGIHTACGICVIFIGIAGAMEGMLCISDGAISGGGSMLIIFCLVPGTLIGEIMNLEAGFENFGEWLKVKTGNAGDKAFVNAFVTASLTICIGAMAVVGSIQDGIYGDWSLLAVKSVLDMVIILVMTATLGKGAAFSAISILVFEGIMTAFAGLLQPVLNDTAMDNISMVGSILIFCVGMNLVLGRKVRVANMLPALAFAVIAAYLPWF